MSNAERVGGTMSEIGLLFRAEFYRGMIYGLLIGGGIAALAVLVWVFN